MTELIGLVSGVAWIFIGLYAVINIFFALGIYIDAKHYQMRGGALFLGSGGLWALATLMGGVATVGAYWLIHYSSLRSRAGIAENSPRELERR